MAIAGAVGLALIVVIAVPAVLGATTPSHGRKPTPTVTISVPAPQPTVTVTVRWPGPTVTVTDLRPGPTVTVTKLRPGHCPHPGQNCGGD